MIKLSRFVVVGVALLFSIVAFGGVALAVNVNCAIYPIQFGTSIPTFQGPFSEFGSTDCVEVQVTDRFISTEFTIEAWEQGGAEFSDRLVLSNSGPGGTIDICFQSYNDGGLGTSGCDPVGTITTQTYAGDPDKEVLSSGLIYDVPTGQTWYAVFTSQNIGTQSDYVLVAPTPEPGTLGLLSLGLFGLARRLRRKA